MPPPRLTKIMNQNSDVRFYNEFDAHTKYLSDRIKNKIIPSDIFFSLFAFVLMIRILNSFWLLFSLRRFIKLCERTVNEDGIKIVFYEKLFFLSSL